MKKSKLLGAVIYLLASNVNAAVIDFEEFQSSAPLDVSVIGDLEFSRCTYPGNPNICVTTGVYVRDISSFGGSLNLAASGVMGADFGTNLSVKAANGSSFDFTSVYFGITHPFDPITGTLQGIRDGEVVYSSTNIVPNQAATLYQFDWQSVDEVVMSTFGGTGWFVMDDIEYSVVPIPPALWLFGSGLLGLIGIARKKTQ
jgi:hypothetical protein